jgi:hypothetical protein
VQAESSSETAVIAALKARRTIATYAMRGIKAELPGLGEVKHTGAVELHLTLSRPVGEIVLFKEGQEVRRWSHASEVHFDETITHSAAYVFAVRDGGGRLMTSAVWFEPQP